MIVIITSLDAMKPLGTLRTTLPPITSNPATSRAIISIWAETLMLDPPMTIIPEILICEPEAIHPFDQILRFWAPISDGQTLAARM
eukprot:CAMPEP_0184303270 /NCGR_PEP_ID=MMETSP1049-20130417/13050_1 /TAXON_ID=77928 /ORGANISM="Proteomonas sulcata, Strain CCMP704" /LENGTH=85 /DNA_ID=CAMNT_0026614761 /DNA_START=848 /DNA_END=1108 /DNA_ORIENTATION=-